jgi:hypothetical protein
MHGLGASKWNLGAGISKRRGDGEKMWISSAINGEFIIAGWWFGTYFLFFNILGIIIPTDFHIFQRGRYTTNQIVIQPANTWISPAGSISLQMRCADFNTKCSSKGPPNSKGEHSTKCGQPN